MLVDSVVDRLATQIPDLRDRVKPVAELAALVQSKSLPQVMPAAFVVPLGLRGREPAAATGTFRQDFGEVVGVVLMARAAGDVTGKRALDDVDALMDVSIAALAGWAPALPHIVGVFQLDRGRLVSLSAGAVIYQLDFSIHGQLRNTQP